MTECKKDSDENRLIREGTTQEERFPVALDPAYAPVDDWKIEHGILFAKAYAKFLKYYDAGNREAGDWQPFFSKDVSALLAVMAMQDVEECRNNIKNILEALKGKTIKELNDTETKKLGEIINCIGIIAKQIDVLKEGLPDEYPLKATLSNLVKNRLAADFKKLILCCKDCFGSDTSSLKRCTPAFKVIRSESYTDLITLLEGYSFSTDWICPIDEKITWIEYLRRLYNPSIQIQPFNKEDIEQIFNNFLLVYARTVNEARRAFEDSLKKWNRHEPHYALFLSFLRLMAHARNELNTLTGRHLDFYYREILQFKEKEVVPPKAHVLVELAKQVPSYLIKAGEEFKAGKDELGKDVFFASERDFLANRAKVAELKTVFRYQPNKEEFDTLPELTDKNIVSKKDAGRIYASSVANSEDGQGGELVSEDKSWHPFFNKKYEDNKIYQKEKLLKIEMPKAAVGFAIASHYLWMAGGTRTITIIFSESNSEAKARKESKKETSSNQESSYDQKNITCYLTGEKNWIKAKVFLDENNRELNIQLSGGDPAIVPYSSKIHGYNFQTELPVLRVELTHKDDEEYFYDIFNGLEFQKIDLSVNVCGLKPLAVSNDFGPVDTSKPFQPFGPSPTEGNALIIGLKEIFQKKNITCINANIACQQETQFVKIKNNINIEYLQDGSWHSFLKLQKESLCKEEQKNNALQQKISFFGEFNEKLSPYTKYYDFLQQEHLAISSVNGFIKIKIATGFNQEKNYQANIKNCIDQNKTLEEKLACLLKLAGERAEPPPVITKLTIDYEATTKDTKISQADFFHITPFGSAEQHQNFEFDKKNYLLPQFNHVQEEISVEHEAEFYIGITDLKPPQNLSLLFQVADGTANPEKEKPKYPHIHWSYLRNNEWIPFLSNAVEDSTDELITSGIITFAVPRDASDDNTLLPAGMHWIRAAVSSDPDAVCRLRMVEAQAVKVKFVDKENDPNFSAKTLLKDSITKLARPAAEVKKVTQPFPSYGGRGKESSKAFYTRVSERLRHKDRAITLWDYERLILEAFPEVHKVKCLNHTCYDKGNIYDAPGHVTAVTIANKEHHSLPDSLRPNVSLGLHEKIKEFFRPKLSSFIELHIVNPKFEEVKVDFRVKLHQGSDETYYINLLQEAIVRFLSPWAFSGNGSPSFGGKIYKSALINFVEEQDYVDYLTDFQLFVDGGKDIETAEGSDAISILTSAHVSKHIIQITND